MTITLSELRGYITHIHSGGNVDDDLPGSSVTGRHDRFINDAGRWFFSHHPWNFTMRPPASLTFTAGVGHVDLPFDFGQRIAYQMTDGLNYGLVFTTPQSVATRRATTLTVSQNSYWAAVVHPGKPSLAEAPGPPRLELWPVPSSTAADVLTLWYRTRWIDLQNATDAADLPEWAEFPFANAVRQMSIGISMENELAGTDPMDRMAKFKASTIMQDCYVADGLQDDDLGPITGGAISTKYPSRTWRSASASPVADPT